MLATASMRASGVDARSRPAASSSRTTATIRDARVARSTIAALHPVDPEASSTSSFGRISPRHRAHRATCASLCASGACSGSSAIAPCVGHRSSTSVICQPSLSRRSKSTTRWASGCRRKPDERNRSSHHARSRIVRCHRRSRSGVVAIRTKHAPEQTRASSVIARSTSSSAICSSTSVLTTVANAPSSNGRSRIEATEKRSGARRLASSTGACAMSTPRASTPRRSSVRTSSPIPHPTSSVRPAPQVDRI